MSNIGRRVELKKNILAGDKGEKGTIVDDQKHDAYIEGVIKVKLDSGTECNPWRPDHAMAECEYIYEINSSIDTQQQIDTLKKQIEALEESLKQPKWKKGDKFMVIQEVIRLNGTVVTAKEHKAQQK